MGSPDPLRIHAIYPVLNDVELFRASIASIYDWIDGATVVTAYDHDWQWEPRTPDGLIPSILDRTIDPERKIDLIVGRETNQARALNRAMDHAAPPTRSRNTEQQHPGDSPPTEVDYFWIIDSDEIYERDLIPRLLDQLRGGKRYYQVAGYHYFKTWNYRVETPEWFTAFVRADSRLGIIRNPLPTFASKVIHRIPGLSTDLRARLKGIHRIPLEAGFFHHGSYVGPRSRIETKVGSSPHAHQIAEGWLEDVWDKWGPESRDFHPTEPAAFDRATYIPTSDLPPEIRTRQWPDDYID